MNAAWHRISGLTLAIFTLALAGSLPATAQQNSAMSMQSASPADNAFAHGMKEMQRQMADAPMTGNPDQDFVAAMIPHHEGAIDMAEVDAPAWERARETGLAALLAMLGAMLAGTLNQMR